MVSPVFDWSFRQFQSYQHRGFQARSHMHLVGQQCRRPAPGRCALAGPAPCAAKGDLFARAYEVWPPGRWGSSLGRPCYSLLCRSPSWSVLFAAPIPGGALRTKAEGGRSALCRSHCSEGRRLRNCASWKPPAARFPREGSCHSPSPLRRERVTWICSPCSGTLDGDVTPGRCKLHLATWNGVHDPLDLYLEGVFDEWQSDQNRRNFSTCDLIVALIAMPEPDLWLFAGVHNVLGEEPRDGEDRVTTGPLAARRATSSMAAWWSPSRDPADSPTPSQRNSHPS